MADPLRIELIVPELAGLGDATSSGDDEQLAAWYERARKAWQQRRPTQPGWDGDDDDEEDGGSPAPAIKMRRARRKKMARSLPRTRASKYVDEMTGDAAAEGMRTEMSAVRRQSMSARRSLTGVGVKSAALQRAIASRGAIGSIARSGVMAKQKIGAHIEVARAGASAVAYAGAIAPHLASAIPGLGGMPAHTGFDIGGAAQKLLNTATSAIGSGMQTADAMKHIARANLVQSASKNDSTLGLRIAALNKYRTTMATESAEADVTRTVRGAVAGGSEGAVWAATQMRDAIMASPAAFVDSFLAVIKAGLSKFVALIMGRG